VFVSPEICELARGVVGNHSSLSGLPAGGADFTVLVGVDEGGDKSEGFFDISSDGEVADAGVSKDTFSVNNESGSESDSGIFTFLDEGAVASGNALGDVREHGNVHGTKASLVASLLGVFTVTELGVDGASYYLGTDLFELTSSIAEVAHFSRAYESEIERPEEKDSVLAYNLTHGYDDTKLTYL